MVYGRVGEMGLSDVVRDGMGDNWVGGSAERLAPLLLANICFHRFYWNWEVGHLMLSAYLIRVAPIVAEHPSDTYVLTIRIFRVILFSIHNDEWKSFQCHHQTALRSYALSWKPYQGDSLNLPDHRIHKDEDGDALFQLKTDSLPHAHAQTTKTYYKHQDLRIMKAQELKTKTSAQTLIYKIFLQRYQVYQGRLLASFQDDAKYEHVGQDTRSQVYSVKFVVNQEEIYHKFKLISSIVQRVVLTWDGKLLTLQWIERTQEWIVYADLALIDCERFKLCDPNGRCSMTRHPPCTCMEGFEQRFFEEWKASNWSNGCQRKRLLNCGSEYGFQKASRVKLPYTRRSWYNYRMSLREFEMACRMNCSCNMYLIIFATDMDLIVALVIYGDGECGWWWKWCLVVMMVRRLGGGEDDWW
ncbi:G-type lectin S-receptor-like serine/threonine-protein kinase [Tanacetum coccineum]